MFNPALKLVVRLLPFTAAMVASVAIGASTPAPSPRETATPATQGSPLLAAGSTQPIAALRAGPDALDVPLLAQADMLDVLTTAYPVGSLDAALTAPSARAAPRNENRQGFELPQPDRWTSLLATLALGAFFFLRRIV